ncbi:MAG: nicotinate phosphoribosyltransferase [Rhodospirillales bacterium]|nr:nicotinate phosphoribosyltransferase [Alphaproteobacteria bacterium]MCB9986836.1 nicotinate phosphoribosyltransferase [Rhodospirillales bacterium]USO08584.1 MAG: nicotinate phosphoribosyltransferase [Rhodospirillales bacterium]
MPFAEITPALEYPHYREGLIAPGASALWADYYALTMAQALFADGRHMAQAVFHGYVRSAPFGGSYVVTGGQEVVFAWLEDHWRFLPEDIALLRSETAGGARVFSDAFVDFLAAAKLELSIDAMPEGEIAFAEEPIIRVSGPLWQCLMVEAAILNLIGSQSLFATLASHLVHLAGDAPVLDFGLRRGQAAGGLEAARGAWLGGVAGTSNVLARKMYGIPAVGTMGHAFVMAYESEIAAFAAYARAMPQGSVFLVDTYNTPEGVRRAVAAARESGIDLKGVRLDSGDTQYLARVTRGILDAAGYRDAKIIASDGLNYKTITALRAGKAPVDVYAIGAYLNTAPDQPTLNAVYKMAEIDGRPVIKLSEVPGKITIPGALDVIRYLAPDGARMRFDGDTIVPLSGGFDISGGALAATLSSIDRADETNARVFAAGTPAYRPVAPVFDQGRRVAAAECVHHGRARAAARLDMLEDSHKGMPARYSYRVGVEEGLHDLRHRMIRDARRQARGS